MTTYAVGAEPRFFALVPCAGTGTRAGTLGPKQYQPLAGRPLVAHTLTALARVPRLAGTLVVLAPDDEQFEDDLPGLAGERLWLAKAGGASRAETVANGLNELRARGAQPQDWVLVHDAARCLLQPEWVDRLIDACQDDEIGGLLALPLADTLKSEQDGRVAATVDRAGKWAAQTPQMFRLGLLAPALAFAGEQVTDEASAVEALGHRPRLVRGDWENLKITFPPDFALAERLLASRGGPEIRATVPARDFATAQQFYQDLGFTREFAMGDLAGFRMGRAGFLLQRHEAPQAAHAQHLHLTVDDLDALWARIQQAGLAARYGVAVQPPQQRAWGRRDLDLVDPSGVRWTLSERMEVAE
ncbi:2-C-methyl-D-erythritol 4-phosphate cytidylyltransferase [Ideonella sp. 4Y16]|uniref:2-C-methyl-D-erythritol 4-phosphate cytidylyltransferase n=1 Tax=Ideonella alba TaxID=2824118 RepID=A0A940Y8R1_9BURK|nr:2-C-methyl-D-erythritol 4-phosphate cytidylyltransferase [Ideonella alba]MBQ0930928.1 2-C-methyl-D-erythritol 4-phosphate cytidylyltransferase [Ideonella alba]MBQ0942408.1 2-C-methyl-D-erythritol 4-phosphate cytidylyltransferase [Ideonella alba]